MQLRTALVGSRYHKGAYDRLRVLKRGAELTPVAEPENPHDPEAVAVYHGGQHMGYVPRDQAPLVARALAEGRVVSVTLACDEAHLMGAPSIVVAIGGVKEGEWDFLD